LAVPITPREDQKGSVMILVIILIVFLIVAIALICVWIVVHKLPLCGDDGTIDELCRSTKAALLKAQQASKEASAWRKEYTKRYGPPMYPREGGE